MGIIRKKKEIISIHRHGNTVIEVRKFINGSWRSVWQYVRSCFGRGFWVNDKPWSNKDYWKNF